MYCQCLTDGTITWVNNSYCNHVSQFLPELVGTKFPFISKEQESSLLSHITLKNPIIEYEYYNLHLNLWQSWQVEGIFDQDNQLLQYHFLGKDLTKNLLKNLLFLQTIKATELRINQETIVNLSGLFVLKLS